MEEATWGRLVFALRTGLAHAVWRVRSRHAPVPTLPPPSSRPRRLRDPQELLGHKDVTNYHDHTPMSWIAAGRVGAARRTRCDASVPAGAYADPHTTPRENDITKEEARRFETCGRRASLPQVRVMLTGTAALRSYLDPENQ